MLVISWPLNRAQLRAHLSQPLAISSFNHEHPPISGLRLGRALRILTVLMDRLSSSRQASGIGMSLTVAKGVNERRWNDQRARGLRANPTDWKEKVAAEEAAAANPDAPAEAGEAEKKGRGRIVL
ncbi:unnamed protein product [Cutaneotrichosporon oleaginosum]